LRDAFEFAWEGCDANLRGPYSGPAGGRTIPFAIAGGTTRNIRFSRLRSGPAYPEFLPRFDRVVPLVGVSESEKLVAGDDASVVLAYQDDDGDWRALCSADRSVVRWGLDPRVWVEAILSEKYVAGWTRPLVSRVPLLNYSRAPQRLKGALQGRAQPDADRPGKTDFPQLPLDDFVDWLRRLCAALCWGRQPEIADLWPGGRRAAVTITHDVDTGWVFRSRNRRVFRQILDAEISLGFRGGWFIPAAFYQRRRHGDAVRELEQAGHELGSHGWNHDAKLRYQSLSRQRQRLERIARRFSPRSVEGIRTPWYSRSPELFEQLARRFRYDTSVPNASGFFSTGSNSGCCTVFPYRASDGLVELPLTLPPDDVFDPAAGYALARRTTDAIVERGGVVVVILHPQPHQSANPEGIGHFSSFLRWLRTTHGEQLWSATPLEIVNRYCERAGVDAHNDPERLG
jgi:peptidoglycan/xylan/chitin deacetylase (PgdA/CDA1 family)